MKPFADVAFIEVFPLPCQFFGVGINDVTTKITIGVGKVDLNEIIGACFHLVRYLGVNWRTCNRSQGMQGEKGRVLA